MLALVLIVIWLSGTIYSIVKIGWFFSIFTSVLLLVIISVPFAPPKEVVIVEDRTKKNKEDKK
ncbi:MAG: hypothetical protein ACRCYT_00210 [Cetobacterium sp.]